MKTEPLVLSGNGFELAIAPEAKQIKAELLQSAATITRVSGPDEKETASQALKSLANVRIAVGKCREAIKKPVLDIGRTIDARAKEFLAEIEAEENRLNKLIGDYAELVEAERRKVMRELEEKRQAEEKARRDAEEARIKAEREAEAARIAAEKAEWEATTPEEEAKAAAALKEAEEKNRLAAEVAEKVSDIVQVVAIVPAKVEGVKFEYDFEVEDVDALYRFNPSLVKMEAKRSEVLDAIKRQSADGNTPAIPGLKITQKAKVSTR
jgi:hypothetical protein